MALVVNSNIPSISSQRFLTESRREMETAMERLSSGKRINTAGDDAAGHAIAGRMESQIRGLNMAVRNANDAISLVQTAEGSMSEVTDMLQRMRELAVQAANGVNNDTDRASLDSEVQALKAEIDRIASTTTFNNQSILDGSFNRTFQIGYNTSETFDLGLSSVSTAALGLFGDATEDTSSQPELIGRRITTGTAIDAGDVVIDGKEVSALANTADIKDMTDAINASVDTVVASAFNTVVAKSVGTGVVYEGDVAIQVSALGASGDSDYQASKIVQLGASSSMSELVANINAAFSESEVVASTTTDGKLVLSNNSGATIEIVDESGTDAAYDGGTGFLVDADGIGANASSAVVTDLSTISFAAATTATGFITLTSTDGSNITIDHGNTTAATPGSTTDLGLLGFQKNIEDPTGTNNQLIGNQLTSAGAALALDKSTAGVADLIINEVEIYDATLSALSTTVSGKVDLINSFQSETNVVASSYLEKSYDFSGVTFIADNSVELNGTDIAYGANLAAFVANINTATSAHGISAVAHGTNLVLKGEGVGSLNIVERSYNIAVESEDTKVLYQPHTANTAGEQVQIITFGESAVTAGRTINISFGAVAAAKIMSAGAVSFSYTVVSGDDAASVAKAFKSLIHAEMGNFGLISSQSFGAIVTASTTNSIDFSTTAGIFSASITISVSDLASSKAAFAVGAAASSTLYGALRLTSTDGKAISVELGEGDANSAHGFFEMNVGDATWDANSPTDLVSETVNAPVSGMNIASSSAAASAINTLDAALESVAAYRADLGAVENRMVHTVDNLTNVVENTASAQSRIQDADFAVEAAALARAQILQQAGTAMLAQANAAPQNVLSLLG